MGFERNVLCGSLLLFVVLLLTVLLSITLKNTSLQVRVPSPPSNELIDAPVHTVAERLSEAIRLFPTISYEDHSRINYQHILDFHDYLEKTYPKAHKTLQKEVINEYSLLYKWKGYDDSILPIMLCGHLDVVPIEEGTEHLWIHPPFSGALDGDFIWGRGTMDDKSTVLGLLEAAEDLITKGFQPRHTIYFAFGHDEEISGWNGANVIASILKSRGERMEFILDEGLMITKGVIGGTPHPVALVGLAEKGTVTLKLEVEAPGGHSSTPPLSSSSIGILSQAITQLEANPFPANLQSLEGTLRFLGPEMSFFQRVVVSNTWLTEPAVIREFMKSPATAAGMRTTTAVTIVRGGVKENVIPMKASAVANFRIIPSDTVDGVVEYVKRVINDDRVVVSIMGDEDGHRSHSLEPSPVTSYESPSFRTLQHTISEVFPESIVAPSVMIGNTDTRHYWDLTDCIFRFMPNIVTPEDIRRFHGINERINATNYHRIINFYNRLIRNADNQLKTNKF